MHMKNTIIYPSHFELMEQLTDLQAGKLIKSIGQYEKGLLPAIDDDLVKGIFISIKRDFDLQSENYESVCKRNRENAKNAGAKKGNQNARKYNDLIQNNPTDTDGLINNPKQSTIVKNNPNNLKDKDKDKEKDKEKEKMLAVYTAPFIPEIENTEVDYMIDETDIELTKPMLERVIDKFISVDSRFKFQSVMSEINEDYGGFDNLIELYLPNDTTAQQNYKNKKQQYQNGIYA